MLLRDHPLSASRLGMDRAGENLYPKGGVRILRAQVRDKLKHFIEPLYVTPISGFGKLLAAREIEPKDDGASHSHIPRVTPPSTVTQVPVM